MVIFGRGGGESSSRRHHKEKFGALVVAHAACLLTGGGGEREIGRGGVKYDEPPPGRQTGRKARFLAAGVAQVSREGRVLTVENRGKMEDDEARETHLLFRPTTSAVI